MNSKITSSSPEERNRPGRRWARLAPHFFAIALLCLLAGCIPKRIVWSPDARQAAVLGDQGMYLCDSNGALSALLTPDVTLAAWFPDSTRLALVRSVKYTNWADLAPLLPADRRQRIISCADKALAAMQAGQTPDEAAAGMVQADLEAVEVYAKGMAGAPAALGTNWAQVQASAAGLQTLQIATLSGASVSLGPVLATELDAVSEVRVSPDGKAIAYVSDTTKPGEEMLLEVLATSSSSGPMMVDSQVAQFPDWTPDSRALVYIKAVGSVTNSDQLRLASLTRRSVVNQNGAWQLQEKPEEMIALLFHPGAKTRCLADGRILFSGAEVHLPSRAADMPTRQQLYVFDPEKQTPLVALITPQNADRVPQDTSFFEVDPSGRRVALVEKGLLAVLNLATGTINNVPNPMKDDVPTIPVWRSADELCYVTSPPAGGPAQVALWTEGAPRVISASWPAEARKNLLDK